MLSQYNPKTSLFFGHRYKVDSIDEGYMAGGGYLLSKKALKKFGEKLFYNFTVCHANGADEDMEMGRCLSHSAIFLDCRDELHQKRFFPVSILSQFQENIKKWWYPDKVYYKVTQGNLNCCSDTSVSFHYQSPKKMHRLEYYVYNVDIFGLDANANETLPRKFTLNEIIAASDARDASMNYPEHKDYHDIEESEKY